MIEKHPITDRASWLKMRERDVTASVAGALLGVHEWTTPWGLWASKSGKISEDPAETAAMRRGRLLEPVAVELLREDRPEWEITRGAVYYRDPAARIGATPDALARCPRRGLGVIQIKTVEPSILRRKWRQDDGTFEPPLWIAVQAIVEAELTGAEWSCVAALSIGHGAELQVIDIPLTPGLMPRLRAEVAAFWRRVETGEAPDPDYGRDAATIARLYPSDDGTEVDLTGDNRLPEILARRAELKAAIKTAEAEAEAIDAEVKAKIGPASRALVPGWRLSFKSTNRPAYTVQAKTVRTLRINQMENRQ